VICGDVIEGAFSYLYHAVAFKEEFFSKEMGSGPCRVHGSGPPLFEDCFVDVFSYHAVISHVPDISSIPQWGQILVESLSLSLVPTGRAWLRNNHIKLLTLECAKVLRWSLLHSCEVDAIVPLPFIDFDIRYTGAPHLSCIELAILVAFDKC
jgi:hypothetical protein